MSTAPVVPTLVRKFVRAVDEGHERTEVWETREHRLAILKNPKVSSPRDPAGRQPDDVPPRSGMLFRCVSFLVCDMVPPELTKAVYLYVMEARGSTLLRAEQWLGPPALSIRLSRRNSRLRCSPLSILMGPAAPALQTASC